MLSSCGQKIKTQEPKVLKNSSEIASPTRSVRNDVHTQFVLLSFDGSESLVMWQRTRDFAKKMKQENKPLNFTYFISSVYFLPPETKDVPSKIGYSKSAEDIPKRVEQIKLAQVEGHEIASHLNGHFDGSKWSKENWVSEFDLFNKLSPVKVSGFRAPLLGRNKELYSILPKYGIKYDSSGVGKMGDWPVKNSYGTWELPLVSIGFPGGKTTLSMDYNIYLAQTNAKDILRKGTPQWNRYYQQTLSGFQNYFNYNYKRNRAPVIIGNHFSVWNDTLYWEAMKGFAQNVCGLPDVKCGTFGELVEYLENK